MVNQIIEIAVLLAVGVQGYLLFWFNTHYKETLKQLEYFDYYISLLDYNNLSLEMGTREMEPTLEEEAMLHTLEQGLKEKAIQLGLHVSFPQRPESPHDS